MRYRSHEERVRSGLYSRSLHNERNKSIEYLNPNDYNLDVEPDVNKDARPYQSNKPKKSNNSTGLGDTIEKITKATGIKKVVETVSKVTGKDCGCNKRKDKLNELFPYNP